MSKPANVAETAALPPLDERMLKVTMAAAAYQARRVTRSMRMAPAESEDVEQEILLTLLDRRRFFDPARGAWTPFANRIARQAAQVIADSLVSIRKAYGGPLDQPVAGSSEEEADCTLAEATADLTAPTEMDHLIKHDLDSFVRTLPPELRVVAEGALAADGDLADAQRALGLSTSEFYRRLREIRYRLFTIGLVDRRSL